MIDELNVKIGKAILLVLNHSKGTKEAMADAAAALVFNTIEEEGYVVVPREPTDRMMWAGGAALHDRDEDAGGVWTAMITVDPGL